MSITLSRFELVPGVGLTCITTTKFKTECMTINILDSLNQEHASHNALLPNILCRGSKNHPNMYSISAALDDLFGAAIGPVIRKSGELQSTGIYADFPDSRFLPSDENTFNKTLHLLFEILLNPALNDDFFITEYFEGEKKNLIDDINSIINNKRAYAQKQLVKAMCAKEAYSVGRLGSEEDVEKITQPSLIKRYSDLIGDSLIEIFYCGSKAPEQVKSVLNSIAPKLPARKQTQKPLTTFNLRPTHNHHPQRVTEEADTNQGRLCIGFRFCKPVLQYNYSALGLFNALYGGGVMSKLFVNLREKQALCYDVSSSVDKQKGLLFVSMGVDEANFEHAENEIYKHLDNMKSGLISEEELVFAKKTAETSVVSAFDRLGSLESIYFDSTVSHNSYNPQELIHDFHSCGLEEIVKVASDIKVDAVFTLKPR